MGRAGRGAGFSTLGSVGRVAYPGVMDGRWRSRPGRGAGGTPDPAHSWGNGASGGGGNPAHGEYWAKLEEEGVMFAGGPALTGLGSDPWGGHAMFIFKAQSLPARSLTSTSRTITAIACTGPGTFGHRTAATSAQPPVTGLATARIRHHEVLGGLTWARIRSSLRW